VLDRAFRILECFGPDSRVLSLTALSARATLPKATTLRLARKLTEWGALERTPDGRYTIGLRLLEVASLAPRGHGLRATALPYLEDLHHATGQHVLLAVRDGTEAVLVERLSARGAGRVMYRVGGRMPLDGTGVGLVLLAHAPRIVQDTVLAGALSGAGHGRRRGEPERIPPGELRGRLAAIRREGVAVLTEPAPGSITTVAAPVRGLAGGSASGSDVLAALSVVSLTAQAEPAVLVPAVVAVARAVSRAISIGGDVSLPTPMRPT
jgi:DNA-binding IclR family transcriptional regulator